MSNDRSDRLRERRRKTSEKVAGKTNKEDKEVKPDKTESDDDDGPPSVKDRDDWSALQMQLPDDLRNDLEIALDEANLELQKQGEKKLEKLAHWYPLVVSIGVETIEEMDVDEIRKAATNLE